MLVDVTVTVSVIVATLTVSVTVPAMIMVEKRNVVNWVKRRVEVVRRTAGTDCSRVTVLTVTRVTNGLSSGMVMVVNCVLVSV
jgi:hypothetical protein